jgi:endonuclease YncB( thermonuclease family)
VPVPAYVRKATLVRVVDGDTAVFALDHGRFPDAKAVTEAPIRVRGLLCPELAEPGGREAAIAAEELLAGASSIVVQTYRGSFGRTVGDVWMDGALFADVMVELGHGSAVL